MLDRKILVLDEESGFYTVRAPVYLVLYDDGELSPETEEYFLKYYSEDAEITEAAPPEFGPWKRYESRFRGRFWACRYDSKLAMVDSYYGRETFGAPVYLMLTDDGGFHPQDGKYFEHYAKEVYDDDA